MEFLHINMNNTVRQKTKKTTLTQLLQGKKIKDLRNKKTCCRPKTERTYQHCYKPVCIPSLGSFINAVLEWVNMRKNTPYICVYVCKV